MKANPPTRPSYDIGGGPCALPVSETVLLLVDFINPLEFAGAGDLAPAALAAARAAARLKRQLGAIGVPAIYANDNYGIWRSEFSDVLAYCQGLPGIAGEMARTIAPADDDLTILKPRHSAFYATPLELLLSQMKVRRLVITGLAADICVQVTAMDAYLRGFEVWAPADCTAAESPERTRAAIDYMARVMKSDVRPSTDAAARAGRPAEAARDLP